MVWLAQRLQGPNPYHKARVRLTDFAAQFAAYTPCRFRVRKNRKFYIFYANAHCARIYALIYAANCAHIYVSRTPA